MALLRLNRAFTLVQHFHVTAKRKHGDCPLGAIAAKLALPQRRAESHRKTQHLDAAQLRDQIVAEFVKHDQHAKGDDKSEQGREQ